MRFNVFIFFTFAETHSINSQALKPAQSCKSRWFLSQFQISKSRDCLNDFCPSSKSPRNLCSMERLRDSRNSWDSLGLEFKGQSRDFGIFEKKHDLLIKNIIKKLMKNATHFFKMNSYCTQIIKKLRKNSNFQGKRN